MQQLIWLSRHAINFGDIRIKQPFGNRSYWQNFWLINDKWFIEVKVIAFIENMSRANRQSIYASVKPEAKYIL